MIILMGVSCTPVVGQINSDSVLRLVRQLTENLGDGKGQSNIVIKTLLDSHNRPYISSEIRLENLSNKVAFPYDYGIDFFVTFYKYNSNDNIEYKLRVSKAHNESSINCVKYLYRNNNLKSIVTLIADDKVNYPSTLREHIYYFHNDMANKTVDKSTVDSTEFYYDDINVSSYSKFTKLSLTQGFSLFETGIYHYDEIGQITSIVANSPNGSAQLAYSWDCSTDKNNLYSNKIPELIDYERIEFINGRANKIKCDFYFTRQAFGVKIFAIGKNNIGDCKWKKGTYFFKETKKIGNTDHVLYVYLPDGVILSPFSFEFIDFIINKTESTN